jgi:steroid 5-alpha reductase family enzyme
MAGFWRWQLRLRRSGLADAAWPLVTGALAVFYANAADGAWPRRSAIAWMIGSWGARLGVHLVWDAVLGQAALDRVQESMWRFQRGALLALFFSLPALLAAVDSRPTLSPLELAAAGLWVVGFAGETTADRQRVRWRRAALSSQPDGVQAESTPDDGICRAGVWRYVPRAHDVFELITWIAHALFVWDSPFGWAALACPLAAAYRLAKGGTPRAQL